MIETQEQLDNALKELRKIIDSKETTEEEKFMAYQDGHVLINNFFGRKLIETAIGKELK